MRLAGEWSLWEWICLRAPGFPAARVLAVSAPAAAVAVDLLAVEVARIDEARARALAVLERAPVSKPVNKAVKALRRGEVPVPSEALGAGAPLVEELVRLDALRAAAQQVAEQALDAAALATATELAALAAEPRFREALLWQNRALLHGSVASLLRRPVEARDGKTLEQRRVVTRSLQRYTVKNDTIGFFGPVAWARFTDADEAVIARPGATLLSRRRCYFEHWAIDALAQRLAQDPALRPALRPRVMPSVWLDGAVLHRASGAPVELPAVFARALGAIDGTRTAQAIARELAADPVLELDSEADALEVIAELERRHLCTWTVEIPPSTFHPEEHLRALLATAEGEAGDRASRALARMEAGRAAVEAAAGDPERLEPALAGLEAVFEELTGAASTRKGGETYAGRTLVFEDCQRDLEVEFGRPVVERLAPALGLVLTSARWYTHAIAARYGRVLRGVFDELRQAAGGAPVPYLRLQQRLPGLFPGPAADHGIAHDVAHELQARWEAALGVGADPPRVVERTSAQLAPLVASAFDAPAPGWPSARHHAPDLLIAADSVEAIGRGDFEVVLGEIHVGFNTVTLPCLLKEHRDPDVLVRAREADLPGVGVSPVWSKARNRADFFSVSRHDVELETGDTRSARPRAQVLASGALVIEDVDGHLMVRPRAGGPGFHLIAFLEQHLIAESFSRFRLFSRRAHMPRVVIDRVVVQRESWQFAANHVAFAGDDSELARFMAVRRFAAERGMPRHVYAKTDTEAKPFFVDLESPILVDILVRAVKRASRVTLSEMSPGIAQSWLPDAQGGRYTSELRIAVTDDVAWSPTRM